MKLASLKQGGRDGTLVVVRRDLRACVRPAEVAPTLRSAIEAWEDTAPALQAIYDALNAGTSSKSEPFDETACASPLPRAFQFADGSAYLNHVELVRRARGADLPASFQTDPLMYQALSDGFLGPREEFAVASEDWGIDFEGEVSVIVDDVPMGVAPEAAGQHIKLVMLANDLSLRNLIPAELAKGFGFFHGKPTSAFSPVAATLDELGTAWHAGKLHLPLVSHLNGTLIGRPNAGTDMTFDFPRLVAHAAKTRRLSAGTIIGSGTVSNKDRSGGSSCIAELRMLEILEHGAARTPFMRFGDRVRLEMFDTDGKSIFGAIEQRVVRYEGPKP